MDSVKRASRRLLAKGGRFPAGTTVFLLLCGLVFFTAAMGSAAETASRVRLETNLGVIVVELEQAKAPLSVENFLRYVKDGFYDNTIFHRVIKGFMVQGGGFTKDMQSKSTYPAIKNEADNGLQNRRGTLAMARTSEPHSASSQFFINTVDNGFLDHTGKNPRGWGYCVFGRVVEGLEVVDKIAAQPTTTRGMYQNVPVEPVVILKAVALENSGSKAGENE